MTTPVGPEDSVTLPVLWVGVEDLPLHYVNQFVIQVDRGEIFLTLGFLTPPMVIAQSVAEFRDQVEGLGFVAVKPTARLAMSRKGLEELIGVLNRGLQMYDNPPQGKGEA